MKVGIAVAGISAEAPEILGGYWGRTAPCLPCEDVSTLSCRALYLEGPSKSVAVVALDLIGIDKAFAYDCQKAAAQAVKGLRAEDVLICCTHTHTAPATHRGMCGFGNASDKYRQGIKQAIQSTVKKAATSKKAALVRHVRTPPLGLSVNRRERVPKAGDDEAPAKKQKAAALMWFEDAGGTRLGQREGGPTVPYAEAIQFVAPTPNGETLATLVSFACHPVCCGKSLTQSADYVGRMRETVEAETKTAVIALTGAAGDVNPYERGAGQAAADKLGGRVGEALVAALRAAAASNAPPAKDEGSLALTTQTIDVPLEPIPTQEVAAAFLKEQQAWLDKARNESVVDEALPKATVTYAEELLAKAKSASVPGQGGASHARMNMAALALGDTIALVGVEAEVFSEYALHLSAASPFPITITLGYANGCLGYLPTEAEVPYGGYEVVHAHVPYGEYQRLHPTAERTVVVSALEMLCSLHHGGGSAAAPLRALLAQTLPSGYDVSHDTYNSIGVATKKAKRVYYVLSAAEPDKGALLYSAPLGEAKGTPTLVANVTAACDDPPNLVVQGKAHVPLVEDDKGEFLYFASHVGFYTEVDGMETLPVPPGRPKHLGPYPGGCVLRLTIGSGELTPLARLPSGEGVITMAVDLVRERIFCLSWPSAWLVVVGRNETSSSGWSVLKVLDYDGRGKGESVHPRTGQYRPVCRSMAVDPRSGKAYFSNSKGDVLAYDFAGNDCCNCDDEIGSDDVVAALSGQEGLVRDYFGHYDPAAPGSMGYHWRQVQWVDDLYGGCIVGMHGNSGYLFTLRLPPPGASGESARPSLELVERLTSIPSRRLGLGDQFSYGYLGFAVRNRVAYYLTGAPIFGPDGRRVAGKASTNKGEAKGLEHLHLVTYEMEKDMYKDHGPIFLDDRIGYPTYVNSIAIGDDGWVYALGRMPDGLTELFRVRDPHAAS